LNDLALFVLQWLTPYVIAPTLAGITLGVLVKTPSARLAFIVVLLASAAAFAAARTGYVDSELLARASIAGLFVSFGLSGPALIDERLVAAIASVIIAAVCGYFVVGLAMVP